MDEPTETVYLEGGAHSGDVARVSARARRVSLPAVIISSAIECEERYADTGRRTADGRRVFAVEG